MLKRILCFFMFHQWSFVPDYITKFRIQSGQPFEIPDNAHCMNCGINYGENK